MACPSKRQFQKLLRVVQHLAEMILLVAQCCRSKLRRHACILQTRIGGHKADLIHTDASCVRQRSFQLFGQFSGFGFPGGEREGKTRELVLGNAGIELDAGQSRHREQLRKLLFRRGRFEGHAIKQQLGTCCT